MAGVAVVMNLGPVTHLLTTNSVTVLLATIFVIRAIAKITNFEAVCVIFKRMEKI
jgi:hypothetical protein